MARIVIIDNRDSFTFNIHHYFEIAGAHAEVISCDAITENMDKITAADGIVISPGPGTAKDAHGSVQIVQDWAEKKPLMGICLGHQITAHVYGAEIVSADYIFHGKTSIIKTKDKGLFKGLPPSFRVARYHSLVVAPETLPDIFDVTAHIENETTIMAIQHKSKPIYGVQFHPEAILTEFGQDIIRNFVEICELASC